MAGMKALAKETAIYGLSSIVGRFLNWLLVPLYTYTFATAQYGVVSNLYSYTAVALVILNYGMETGFFRFANKDSDPERVYTTSLISVASTSLLFIVLLSIFITPVSHAMSVDDYPLFVWILGVTVAIDAFTNIPFAYLRYKKRAVRFAVVKFVNIGFNIGLNLFFILLCPVIWKHHPGAIAWFYAPLGGEAFGIGWIFVANILSTLSVLCCLLPELTGRRWRFSRPLLGSMLGYSWPLLVLGVAGILSQNMGQITIPKFFPSQPAEAMSMVGIYGGNLKIAIVMVMFAQAFRYAYEPFIFSQARSSGEDRRQGYCDAMKFFIVFGIFIFLAVMFYLPVLKRFVSRAYWEGLGVVPLMMAAELCFGVFFNLSLWYKLTDRTRWGMYLSLICMVLMFALNYWWVRAIGIPNGFMGAAWAALASYFTVMVLSYFLGRRYYPLPYPLKRIGAYVLLGAALYAVGAGLPEIMGMPAAFAVRALLLITYIAVAAAFEHIPVLSPMLKKLLRRR